MRRGSCLYRGLNPVQVGGARLATAHVVRTKITCLEPFAICPTMNVREEDGLLQRDTFSERKGNPT